MPDVEAHPGSAVESAAAEISEPAADPCGADDAAVAKSDPPPATSGGPARWERALGIGAVALVVAVLTLVWAFGGFAPNRDVRWIAVGGEMDGGDLVYTFDHATATMEEITYSGDAGWVVRVYGTVRNPNDEPLAPKVGDSTNLATRLGTDGQVADLTSTQLGASTLRTRVAPGDEVAIVASFEYRTEASMPDTVDCAVSPQVFSVNSLLDLDRTPTWHLDNEASPMLVRLPLQIVTEAG